MPSREARAAFCAAAEASPVGGPVSEPMMPERASSTSDSGDQLAHAQLPDLFQPVSSWQAAHRCGLRSSDQSEKRPGFHSSDEPGSGGGSSASPTETTIPAPSTTASKTLSMRPSDKEEAGALVGGRPRQDCQVAWADAKQSTCIGRRRRAMRRGASTG